MSDYDGRVDLQQMRYVVAIAEEGGFTRAAARCHVVQSALSHQVARLERELGVTLFERSSRAVHLTPAGRAFLAPARRALSAAGLARDEAVSASGDVRGTLRIGTVPTFGEVRLPDVLGRFRERFPRADVSVVGLGSAVLVERVQQGSVDVALIGVPERFAVPEGVRQHEVSRNELVLATRDGAPEPAARSLADLADATFVDHPVGTQARAETDDAFARSGVVRTVAFEVDQTHTLLDFVESGLAVGLVPEHSALHRAGVRSTRLADPPIQARRVVWHREPGPAARAFLALLAEDGVLPGGSSA